jgi:hypothetical protein
LTVAPGEKISVTSATGSRSSQVLTVTATDTNAMAILSVLNADGKVHPARTSPVVDRT